MTALVLIAFSVLANAAASVLLKISADPTGGTAARWAPAVGVGGALACYGLAFLLYAVALRRLPLNVAQPLTTIGATIAVALASRLWLREEIAPASPLAYGLLAAGLVLLSLRAAA